MKSDRLAQIIVALLGAIMFILLRNVIWIKF